MYNFTSFVIISMPLKKLVYVHSKRMILKKISSKVVRGFLFQITFKSDCHLARRG